MGSDQQLYTPISIKQTHMILKQLKGSICKIYNEKEKATAFFCIIPFGGKSIPTLITSYHIIDEKYCLDHQKITITLNDNDNEKHIIIPINDLRKKYFSEKHDIAIIQITKKDEIQPLFLELDESIFQEKDEKYFKNKAIYNISYPKGVSAMISYGLIKEIDGYKINHLCSPERGSTGCPIINLDNHKVLGLNVRENKNKDDFFNIGYLIRKPINEFISEMKKRSYLPGPGISYNYPDKSITIENKDNEVLLKKNITNDSIKYNINNNFKKNVLKKNSFENSNVYNLMNQTYNYKKENKITVHMHLYAKHYKKEFSFLNKNNKIDAYINKDNTKIIINGIEKSFRKSLTAKEQKEQYYEIVLIFKTKLKNCQWMFMDCTEIESIDLSSFDSKEVLDMSYMFHNCTNLAKINLKYLNTEKVTNMSNMFFGCVSLRKLDVSSFNTHSLVNMHEMFENCKNLAEIVFSPSFNTIIVGDMEFIFVGCNNLKNLSFLEPKINEKLIYEFKKNLKIINK